jgi:hypothetical protein
MRFSYFYWKSISCCNFDWYISAILYRVLDSLELSPADILSSIESKDDIELVLKYRKPSVLFRCSNNFYKASFELESIDIDLLLDGGEKTNMIKKNIKITLHEFSMQLWDL